MLTPYLVIRGFNVGENSYSDVLRRLVSGVSAFRTDALPLPGSGSDDTSLYLEVEVMSLQHTVSHVPDYTVSCLRLQYEPPMMREPQILRCVHTVRVLRARQ